MLPIECHCKIDMQLFHCLFKNRIISILPLNIYTINIAYDYLVDLQACYQVYIVDSSFIYSVRVICEDVLVLGDIGMRSLLLLPGEVMPETYGDVLGG